MQQATAKLSAGDALTCSSARGECLHSPEVQVAQQAATCSCHIDSVHKQQRPHTREALIGANYRVQRSVLCCHKLQSITVESK